MASVGAAAEAKETKPNPLFISSVSNRPTVHIRDGAQKASSRIFYGGGQLKGNEQKRPGRAGALPWFRGVLAFGLALGLLGQGTGSARAAEDVAVLGPAEVRRVIPVGRAVGIKDRKSVV